MFIFLKNSLHLKETDFLKALKTYQRTLSYFFLFPHAICSQHESSIKSNHTSLNLYQWRIKLQALIYLQKARGVISVLDSQMPHSQTPCCHGNLTPPLSALLPSKNLLCSPSDPCLSHLPWVPHFGQAAAASRTGAHLTLSGTSKSQEGQKVIFLGL